MTQNALLVDYDLCFGCHACEVACKQENTDRQGISNIAYDRRKLVELAPEAREAKPEDVLWQKLALMGDRALAEFCRKNSGNA